MMGNDLIVGRAFVAIKCAEISSAAASTGLFIEELARQIRGLEDCDR